MLSSRLHDFESTPPYQLMQDAGLEVTAFFTGQLERATAFIGLGPEPAAQNVRSVLKAAVRKAQGQNT